MKKTGSAFSLVEVTLAIGVAGFCLLAVFGLLSTGVSTNRDSIEQTAAARLASHVTADLRSTPATRPATNQISTQFGLAIPATGSATHAFFLREDGALAGAVNADAVASLNPRYRVTLTLKAPTTPSVKSATMAHVLVTWPAMADPKVASPPSKFGGSFEMLTALDRN